MPNRKERPDGLAALTARVEKQVLPGHAYQAPIALPAPGRKGLGIAYILRGRGAGIQAAHGRLEDILAENADQPDGSAQIK